MSPSQQFVIYSLLVGNEEFGWNNLVMTILKIKLEFKGINKINSNNIWQ